jgi:hypothetical protein
VNYSQKLSLSEKGSVKIFPGIVTFHKMLKKKQKLILAQILGFADISA